MKAYDQAATRVALKYQAEFFAGKEGSMLWVVSAKDGTKIQETKLDVALVFDGMIAAKGRLFMSTIDGKVVCVKAQ